MQTAQTQIRFIPGKMERYISTRKFTLGGTSQEVYEGQELLYDGTNVELNGARFLLPTLRGAIRMGWIVPADEYDAEAPPMAAPSANIQVRAANDLGQNPLSPPKKSAIVTVESDERVVMSSSARTAAANQRTSEVRQSQGRQQPGAYVARGSSSDLIGGSEFGVPVERAFRTAAKTGMQITPNNVGTAIRDADLVKIQPGEGISEDQLLSRMSDDERAVYFAEKEARKGDIQSRTPGYVPPPATTTNLARNNQSRSSAAPQPSPRMMTASSPAVVGKVAPTQARVQEGITVGVSSGGGIETFDASGMTGKPVESVVEQEGITFRNTNGPKRDQPVQAQQSQEVARVGTVQEMGELKSRIDNDGTADYRRMVAKTLCPDFPNDYSFSDHWKRRLAMIRLNYEGRPDIIRAIFAAESDEFKKLLIEEFPEAFPS